VAQHAPLIAVDRTPLGTICVDRQPRSQAQWRSRPLPGSQVRSGRQDAVSIRERPASVEDRAVPGHWEGDLIGGSRNSYVATLVERHSRYVMLVKVANKDTESVVSALIKQSQRLPSELYRSLTRDRGKETRRSSAPDIGHRGRRLLL
jgi:IS30 family transposase